MKRLTNEGFITKANKCHNNTYDYSKVDYKSSNVKIRIRCPKHGEFKQTPNSHLSGRGCPNCAGNIKKTGNVFTEEANIIHLDRYDYSKVIYKNAKTKVKIVCPKHGEFKQTPNRHLHGDGCLTCGYESVSNKNSHDKIEFIYKANLIHNNKYDYNSVMYEGSKVKVVITCPEHGNFEQTPGSHLRGCGCARCSYDTHALRLTKSVEQFISEAKEIHGDRYDYALVNYKHTNKVIKITCPKHGNFKQTPMKHLQGQGCPICGESKLERSIRGILMDNNIEFVSQYGRDKNGVYLSGLTIDFYLPKYNVGIECQGIQHFEPVDFGNRGVKHANKAFFNTLKNDIKKYKMCVDNNIRLLYYTTDLVVGEHEYYADLIMNLDELIVKIKNDE